MGIKTWATWVSPVASVLFLVVFVALGDHRWSGEYLWTAERIEGSLLPAAVLASVAMAVDVVKAPRSRRYLLAVWVGLALPAVAALGLSSASWPQWSSPLAGWAWAHLGVSLLSIGAVLALGFVLSAQSAFLGPIAVAGVLYLALDGRGLVLLGSSNGSLLGYEPSPGVLLAQFITALVALGLALALVGRGRAGASISAIMLALLALSPQLSLTEYHVVASGDTQCVSDAAGPRTCVSAQHARLSDSLDYWTVQWREATQAAGMAEGLPVTVAENYPATRPGFHDAGATFPVTSGPEVIAWALSMEELAPGERVSA
ncbi:hypothetical protein [Corynebacterium lowii]|uniref:Uncharacterized protein n=1 Tax=Corynebacterium lowii TaxID=1544413 RepID=A0A0Q1E2Y8_9CORY|nr:hypothetical protein [Corynebacterium lowii]KQB86982.1 hypothetical protein Clow_00027 [Corynebacterium lowii]MDP9852437.1 hypothetical protein [Corynebacterium lowii]